MGPHDRVKLQAKLDLAKAKVLRQHRKTPAISHGLALQESRDLQVRVFCNQPIAFLAPPHPGSAVGSASPSERHT